MASTIAPTKSRPSIRTEMDQYTLQHLLPKAELHAHLNGSIPLQVLQDLAEERNVQLSPKFLEASNHQHRSLNDCFALFAELPAVINDLPALSCITKAALQLFADHHVVYLELRTTPKCLARNFREVGTASKREYLETVIKEMKEFEEKEEQRFRADSPNDETKRLPMVCRLIVSVDRSRTLEEARENVDLAIQLRSESDRSYVVGVDLGGNPTKQSFGLFAPVFAHARAHDMRVTIHCAEVPDCAAEVQDILEFRPDRLGHAVLLPDPTVLDTYQIPVESCPTSNLMTLQLDRDKLSSHTMLCHWLETGYPVAICTDDPGIFDTTPTKELWMVQEEFGCDLASLTLQSIQYAFCDAATKNQILARTRERVTRLHLSRTNNK